MHCTLLDSVDSVRGIIAVYNNQDCIHDTINDRI